MPLSGDLCRLSFPDAAARPFADDSVGAPDEAAGSDAVAPDVIRVGGEAAAACAVAAGAEQVARGARVAYGVVARARRRAAAPWPDAERGPHEAFESAAAAAREPLLPVDGTFPADAGLVHAVRRFGAAFHAAAELLRGTAPGVHCSPPPVAGPARNWASS